MSPAFIVKTFGGCETTSKRGGNQMMTDPSDYTLPGDNIEYVGECRKRGHRGYATNGVFDGLCSDCEAEGEEAEMREAANA